MMNFTPEKRVGRTKLNVLVSFTTPLKTRGSETQQSYIYSVIACGVGVFVVKIGMFLILIV